MASGVEGTFHAAKGRLVSFIGSIALAAGGSFNSPFRGRTLRRYLESRRPLARRP
jgi:hypothetical protein